MIIPDLNVLLYATNASVPQHALAHSRLAQAFSTDVVGLPMAVLIGFLRLTTRTGILARPLAVDAALSVVDYWVNLPSARQLDATARHLGIVGRLLLGAGRGGGLSSDAHLAAYAIEHNATLLTFDHDFLQFSGLRTELLASSP